MPPWEWNPMNVPPSYIYIFVLMILEGMSLPIPSEVIMPLVVFTLLRVFLIHMLAYLWELLGVW